jgi:glycosyltransferase
VTKPSISVITPLLNRAAMLPDALASLKAQTGATFEHLVVDGGSNDGSPRIAQASGATVIEATGSSIYEAINIGLARAQGDFICLLNSDDRLGENALPQLSAALADPAIELARGRARVEHRHDEGWVLSDDGAPHNPSLSLRSVLLEPANINACMFRASLVQRIGMFDLAYPISADREWLARALLDGAHTTPINETTYVYRAHAESVTIGMRKPATMQWVREHLAFTRQFLRRPNLRASDRTALLAFHAKESAHLASLQLERWELSGRELGESFAASPLWPLHAAGPLAAIAARRLKRAFSS